MDTQTQNQSNLNTPRQDDKRKRFNTKELSFIGLMGALMYGILAIPTNMWGGLPGIYKVLISLATGLIFDTVIYFFRYKIKGLFVGSVTTYVILVPVLLWFYTQLNIPGAEKVLKYWPIMIVIFFALFSLGIWIGLKIFNRIKNKRTIRLVMDN